jgi:hypothetical protein
MFPLILWRQAALGFQPTHSFRSEMPWPRHLRRHAQIPFLLAE